MNVFGVLLVALPVIAIVQVWGGIDLPRVRRRDGRYSPDRAQRRMCQSDVFRFFPPHLPGDVRELHSRRYLGTGRGAVGLGHLANPISFQVELNETINQLQDRSQFLNATAWLLAEYAAVHVTIAVICFLIALAYLRRFANRGMFSWVRNVTVTVGREWTPEGGRRSASRCGRTSISRQSGTTRCGGRSA